MTVTVNLPHAMRVYHSVMENGEKAFTELRQGANRLADGHPALNHPLIKNFIMGVEEEIEAIREKVLPPAAPPVGTALDADGKPVEDSGGAGDKEPAAVAPKPKPAAKK